MTTPAPTADPTSPADRLRTLGSAMVVVLLAQFLVGMANTFWLQVPEEGSAWQDNFPAWLLTSHLALGTAVLVLGVWILVVAVRSRSRAWTAASVVGVVGIVVAFGAGTAFMGEVSNDVSSFVMAVGWALATGGYALGLAARPAA